MPIKYTFLDDLPTEDLAPYIKKVERASSELKIFHQRPGDFEKTIARLQKKVGAGDGSEPDGYILDLRLDEKKEPGEKMATYPGQTVAQQLRSMMARGKLRPVPIVVWSVENRIKSYYAPDDTAKDLFDGVYGKDKEITKKPAEVAKEMICLAEGYARIREIRLKQTGSFERMLGLTDEAAKTLDPRIGERYRGAKKASAHEVARYIHRELILARGPLIDERVLAARLGIDPIRSKGWYLIRARVSKSAAFHGVFNEVWPRWWGASVEEWWRGVSKNDEPLRKLNAAERVEELANRTRAKDLVAAKPISKNYSSVFWTICQASGKPLDPLDGFRGQRPGEDILSWQEPFYLSMEALLGESARAEGLRLHPLERERFVRIKKELRKKSGT